MTRRRSLGVIAAAAVIVALTLGVPAARAQDTGEAATPRLDLYGFAMLDMGYDFGAVDPDWYDVLRPTKLPAYEGEFGEDGETYAGVRQSRLGVKAFIPTKMGEIKTIFEFELFGTGVDAGQTTFRLRHAWGELGHFGAGQTWSPFMDPDVFPNSVEYWGPNGMVFFRNVQLRWTPILGDTLLMFALERPGASADAGVYADRIELEGVEGRFPLPDLSAQLRFNRGWGHVQLAGIVRKMEWDDTNDDSYDLSGSATGWGVALSSSFKVAKDTLRLQVVYGEGIENYMNDAPVDVGVENNLSDPVTPIVGKALPILGVVAFYDRTWSDSFTTSIGYSMVDVDNTDGQAPSAFAAGQYALVNLMYYPVSGLMLGPEVQWGERENYADGWTVDDLRVQFSVKYNFGHSWGGTS